MRRGGVRSHGRSCGLALLLAMLSLGGFGEAQEPGATAEIDKNVPAREYYENIQIFTSDAVSAAFLDQLMEEISFDLGVSCDHCHNEDALGSDDLSAEKLRVRARIPEMWSVVSKINQEHFPGMGGLVRCWTCHRGSAKPARLPAELAGAAPPGLFAKADPASSGALASEQYENLQILGDVPGSSLEPTMELIAASLGFECTDCHTGDDFANDEISRKETARSMMRMMRSIDEGLFPGEQGPTCWTCHRGSSQPEYLRPDR